MPESQSHFPPPRPAKLAAFGNMVEFLLYWARRAECCCAAQDHEGTLAALAGLDRLLSQVMALYHELGGDISESTGPE